MSQSILFAIDALLDAQDELRRRADKALFNQRPVAHGDIRQEAAVVSSCITLLNGITPKPGR